MGRIVCKAHAKINLFLQVLGKRGDGYHDLRMVMQSLTWHDVLTICKTDAAGQISMEANAMDLPTDGRNLIVQAGQALLARFDSPFGVHIVLEKRIFTAAGLGGGSADCAAALRGIRDLLALPVDDHGLAALGATLGADVPYCLHKGSKLAEGIGECLTELPAVPPCFVLLAKPPVSVSTAEVFGAYRPSNDAPDWAAMQAALAAKDLAGIGKAMANDLESVTIERHSVIADIKRLMLSNGAAGSLMSGSGPTVFGLFAGKQAARRAEAALRVALPFLREVCITEIL